MADVRGPALRALDESSNPRAYWRGLDEDGGEWLFESVVDDDGRRIVVKQLEVTPDGSVKRYWWRHLEDSDGFLTDQPIDEHWDVTPISADEFAAHWSD